VNVVAIRLLYRPGLYNDLKCKNKTTTDFEIAWGEIMDNI
jgi:hypothetical protein